MGATFEVVFVPFPEAFAEALVPLAAVAPPFLLAAALVEAVAFLPEEDAAAFFFVVVDEVLPVVVSLSFVLLLAGMRHLNGRRSNIVHTANLSYFSLEFQ
jgi:uncharacterized membrane protein YozB (DUF420 family)